MKIYIKSLFKLIKSNLSRFITLALIIVLGIGFLVGIFSISPDLKQTADTYFKDSKMSEVYLMSSTGFLSSDIDYLEELFSEEDVIIRETYEEDKYVYVDSLARVAHVIYTDLSDNTTDIITLEEGSFPTNSDEVVVERSGNYLIEVEVGDIVEIDNTTYTVSGIVSNSWYMMKERYDSQTINASLDTVIYLPIEYYTNTISSKDNYLYTNLYLYFGLTDNVFDDSFEEETDKIIEIISKSNFEENHNTNFKTYLENISIENGAYDEAILAFFEELYESYGMFLPDDYDTFEEMYYAGEEITISLFNLTISKDIVAEEFTNKTGDLYDFSLSLFGENTTLGESIVSSVSESITEEYESLDKEIYYLNSLDNYSTYYYLLNVEKVEDVAIIFPIFFFIIASLVALTSLRRLVIEERSTLGTLRALGYTKFACLFRYIIYGVVACAIGSLLGIALGIALIPLVVYNIFNTTAHMPTLCYVYDTPFITGVVLAMIALIILVVVLSVHSALKESPASLLIPKAPKPGRRIFLEKIGFFWKRLSFKYKSSIRNMIRYKRNLFMMIIGIGGCTSLILLAFGLQNSLDAVSNRQFEEIVLYDALVHPEENITEIDSEYVTSQYQIYYSTYTIDDYTIKVINTDSGINSYFGFYVNNKKYSFTEDDVIISKLISNDFDLDVGDTITYNGTEFIITGVMENYVDNYLFIGTNVVSYDTNRIILSYSGIEEREFTEYLLETEQIISVEYVSSLETAYSSMINNMTLIVLVIIIFAACLAVVVIFNLTNINVSERKRELATLKVLGYKNTEVHGYMARETFVLTAIGILIGLGVGVLLHRFVASIIDTTSLMAGRTIEWTSYIYTILLTMGFSLVVDLCFIPYYRKISMTDSLKAVE